MILVHPVYAGPVGSLSDDSEKFCAMQCKLRSLVGIPDSKALLAERFIREELGDSPEPALPKRRFYGWLASMRR